MRPGVKKITIRLAVILFPFALVFGWGEIKIRSLPDSYLQKREQIELQKDSIRILVLGSSHAFNGIDPAFFSCTGYNLANSSQTLYFDTRLCLKYLDELPELKGVIITVSYFTLWFEMNENPQSGREYFYFHRFGISGPTVKWYDPRRWLYSPLFTWEIFTRMMLGRIDRSGDFGDIKSNGWKRVPPHENLQDLSVSSCRAKVLYHTSLMRPGTAVKVTRYLEELLDSLRNRGIAAAFVSLPVFKGYASFMDPSTINQNREILGAISSRFGIPYIDYQEDARFDTADFSDNDHLNYLGAEKFSRILNNDLISRLCDVPRDSSRMH